MVRLHITGAAGAGTTTLGSALAAALEIQQFDTDDFYWSPVDPPFSQKRAVEERHRLLDAALAEANSWVLSGSISDWGNPLIPRFDFL